MADEEITVKESSDELNPTVAVRDSVSLKPTRTATDYLALAIATCGVGLLPLAPGTWGSIVGLIVYAIVRGALMQYFFAVAVPPETFRDITYSVVAGELIVMAIIVVSGIWAASRTERLSGKKDPGKVVIDEVAGQYIALLPVPLWFWPGWWLFIVAFLLFRLFDIVKPYPARKFESLHGGLGIMADDLVAGVYAAIVVAVLAALFT